MKNWSDSDQRPLNSDFLNYWTFTGSTGTEIQHFRVTPSYMQLNVQIPFCPLPLLVVTFATIEILLKQSHECRGLTDTFVIHHWKIARKSYIKLSRVGVQFTTTDRAIRPRIQLTLRVNFVNLPQFHLLFSFQVLFWSLSLLVTTLTTIEISHR